MPRKKPAETEILPPEDDQQSRGRKRLVEAEHTIKYSAPVPVTVEESEVEDSDLLLDDDPVDVEKKRKRKTAKTERDELRKKLMNHGVTAASTLKLIIERYVHSDGPDSGTTAEKSHCTKYGCDEAHVLNQDYMDVAAKWGSGRYWFTLYKDGTIVSQWEKRLEPSRPIVQHVNPNDPTSPQVIIQTNGDGQQQQPMSMRDIMKAQKEAFKEQLEMAKLMREAYGMSPEQPQQQSKSEEEILASAILKQPDVIENVVGSVIKRFGGASGKDDEPWYADVVRDAVKSGQAAQIVQVAIDRIFNGFSGLFPGRQDNGQAPISQTALQNQPGSSVDRVSSQEGFPQGQQSLPQSDIARLQSADMAGAQEQQNSPTQQATVTPAEQALATVIADCQKKIPPQITFTNLMAFADAINDQAPAYSIDGWIEYFGTMPIDGAIEFVKTLPNGEAVASLPHAKEWTEQLQKLIKESQEGDSDE